MEAERTSVETEHDDKVRCRRDSSQTENVTGSRSRVELVRLSNNGKKLKCGSESCSYYFFPETGSHRLERTRRSKRNKKMIKVVGASSSNKKLKTHTYTKSGCSYYSYYRKDRHRLDSTPKPAARLGGPFCVLRAAPARLSGPAIYRRLGGPAAAAAVGLGMRSRFDLPKVP